MRNLTTICIIVETGKPVYIAVFWLQRAGFGALQIMDIEEFLRNWKTVWIFPALTHFQTDVLPSQWITFQIVPMRIMFYHVYWVLWVIGLKFCNRLQVAGRNDYCSAELALIQWGWIHRLITLVLRSRAVACISERGWLVDIRRRSSHVWHGPETIMIYRAETVTHTDTARLQSC